MLGVHSVRSLMAPSAFTGRCMQVTCHFVASISLHLWGLFLAEGDLDLQSTVFASYAQKVLNKFLQLLARLVSLDCLPCQATGLPKPVF